MGSNWGTFLLACGTISAILAAGAALVKAGRWFWDTMRRLGRLADDLTGEPPRPGSPHGRPGVLDRLTSIEGQLAVIIEFDERLHAVEVAVARLAPAAVDATFHGSTAEP